MSARNRFMLAKDDIRRITGSSTVCRCGLSFCRRTRRRRKPRELVTTLRNMFDLRYINSGQTADTVELRGPPAALDACAKLLEQLEQRAAAGHARCSRLSDQPPTDAQHRACTSPTLLICSTFPPIALAGLAGQNIQQLINQLISSGGINQAGSSALSGLAWRNCGDNRIPSSANRWPRLAADSRSWD